MQASESPGGDGANSTWADFPKNTPIELCETKDTPTCLTGHKYETPEFGELPTAETFKYDTNKDIEEKETKLDQENLKLCDPNFPTDADGW